MTFTAATRLCFGTVPHDNCLHGVAEITLGVGSRSGQLLVIPLLFLGVASPAGLEILGDPRAYGMIQFYPILALPLMLLLSPPRYSEAAGIGQWPHSTVCKNTGVLRPDNLERCSAIERHPWKHMVRAVAMLRYVQTMRQRKFRAAQRLLLKYYDCGSTVSGDLTRVLSEKGILEVHEWCAKKPSSRQVFLC